MSDGTKILLFIIFTVSAVLSPEKNLYLYISHFLIIVMAGFYFRMKYFDLLKRVMIGLPFILIFSASAFLSYRNYHESLLISLSIVLKYSLVFLWGIIIFSDIRIYRGLKQLHTPNIFISIITLMERFIFIFKCEIQRIVRAMETRTFRKRKLFKIILAKNLSSVMLIRGFERSQQIYNAMSLRGFDGEVRFILDGKFGFYDIILLFIFAVVILSINMIF